MLADIEFFCRYKFHKEIAELKKTHKILGFGAENDVYVIIKDLETGEVNISTLGKDFYLDSIHIPFALTKPHFYYYEQRYDNSEHYWELIGDQETIWLIHEVMALTREIIKHEKSGHDYLDSFGWDGGVEFYGSDEVLKEVIAFLKEKLKPRFVLPEETWLTREEIDQVKNPPKTTDTPHQTDPVATSRRLLKEPREGTDSKKILVTIRRELERYKLKEIDHISTGSALARCLDVSREMVSQVIANYLTPEEKNLWYKAPTKTPKLELDDWNPKASKDSPLEKEIQIYLIKLLRNLIDRKEWTIKAMTHFLNEKQCYWSHLLNGRRRISYQLIAKILENSEELLLTQEEKTKLEEIMKNR